jgi:hypothetical protein
MGRVGGGRRVYGRKAEEFAADFYLVSKRTLAQTPFAWRIFELHFLAGHDWRACGEQLGITKGTFFHEVYDVEQRLGRALRELRPYPLFPLDEYFGTATVAAYHAKAA